jgi:DNA-binding NtrC family response regulator
LDDDPQVHAALRRLQGRESFDPLTTVDPREALRRATSRAASLVIADQRMPGMSGVELLQALEEASPSTARILLTAYPGDPLVVGSAKGKRLLLIGKPWDDNALKTAVQRRLSGGSG